MRNQIMSLVLFAGVALGCAAHAPASSPEVPAPITKSGAAIGRASEPKAPLALERRVGDYMVHLISGNFRKQPALFTERVLGREGGAWIIELMVEDTSGKQTLRAWIDDNGEVKKVTEVAAHGEVPAKLADYEALLASVSVVPDENEGLTASTSGTCTVGPAELDCETKSYRVRLGERDAELGITNSAALPGGDISGEITLSDGTVIFRSELVERGNAAEAASDSVAALDESAPAPAK